MTPPWLTRFAERYLPASAVRAARRAARRLAERRYRRRVAALRREHLARNAGLPPDELRLRNGVVLKVTPFTREMYEYFCYRDPSIVAEFDVYARVSAGKTRLLDIGAEHGFFSLAFTGRAGGKGRAVAVEPSPVAYPVLVDQLRLNPAAAVTPLNLALGEADGEIEMAVRGNHAVTAFGLYGDLAADRRVVPVKTLDGLCRDLGFEPDLMKVDVEGYELFVLRGAREVLDRFSPVLLLEIHPEHIADLGQTVADLLELLARSGYANIDPATGRPAPLPAAAGGVLRVVFQKAAAPPPPQRRSAAQ